MTEAAPKIAAPPPETEKIFIPTDEEKTRDIKQLILTILGYASLVFIVLSLFFPFWNWYNLTEYHYVSLWQGTDAGVPFDYWTVFFTFIGDLFAKITAPLTPFTDGTEKIAWSIFGVNISLVFIILLIRYFWKRQFPKTGFFTTSILLGAVYGVGFPYYAGFSFSFTPPYISTPIYGPTWGLAFGWWALFIGGMIAFIRKLWLEKIEREKREEGEGITFKV